MKTCNLSFLSYHIYQPRSCKILNVWFRKFLSFWKDLPRHYESCGCEAVFLTFDSWAPSNLDIYIRSRDESASDRCWSLISAWRMTWARPSPPVTIISYNFYKIWTSHVFPLLSRQSGPLNDPGRAGSYAYVCMSPLWRDRAPFDFQ
jgi:hypothetical protein